MKKLLSLCCALVLTLGLMAGFTPALAEGDVVELVLVTNSLNNGFPTNLADDWVYEKIKKDIGVSLVVTLLDDYFNTLNARIAGGDIPDIIFTKSEEMRTYAQQDILLDLTPYTEKELAPLMQWIGDTNISPYQYQNKLYALPKNYVNSTDYININVRQDWLDKLGLSVPTNVQELYDVAYAFTFNDPDGNGIADTFGLSGQKGFHVFNTIANSYDTALGNHVIIRDNKVTNALLQPGMKDALAMCKKFVDAGIVDPDCYTTSGTNKAIAGQVGLITLAWSSMYKNSYRKQIADVNPNAKWVAFGPLASEVGAEPCLTALDVCASAGAYSVSADISPEKLEAVFKLVNYIISDEGSKLVYYGLENVHWAYDENGQIKMTDRAAEANYNPTYQLFGRNETEYLNVKFAEAKTEFEHAMNTNRFVIYNSLIEVPDDVYIGDLNDYVNNQLLAFVYGDRSLDEYDKFIQELYDSYAFQSYMDAAAEQLAGYGYIK